MLPLSMRVLLVSHLFPPAHTGGTELYTAQLARDLRLRGHEVHVLATRKEISAKNLELSSWSEGGLFRHELTNNLEYKDFRETWDHPKVDQLFGALLERVRPELVHFQHLLYLSSGCLREAKSRRLPVVLTLHDFWLECPRFGQLVHADGEICEQVVPARCGSCLAQFKWRQTALEVRIARALASLRATTGVDLRPLAQKAARLWGRARLPRRPATAAASEENDSYERAVRERSVELLRRVRENIDCFLSPSQFLAQRLLAWGLPAERVRVVPTGIEPSPGLSNARVHSKPLRLAFFGTLVPLKGAHILLQAWSNLTACERDGAQLVLFGSRAHDPAYQQELERLAAVSGARLGGLLSRAEVARELLRTDLCIVPSTWFENRPLIVLEALQAKTPLLVSDTGPLAELVEEGVSGWRFQRGDPRALADRLRTLLAQPQQLNELFAQAPQLPLWQETLAANLALYAELGSAKPQ